MILYKSWIILFLIVITNNNYNYYTLDTSLKPLHNSALRGYQLFRNHDELNDAVFGYNIGYDEIYVILSLTKVKPIYENNLTFT